MAAGTRKKALALYLALTDDPNAPADAWLPEYSRLVQWEQTGMQPWILDGYAANDCPVNVLEGWHEMYIMFRSQRSQAESYIQYTSSSPAHLKGPALLKRNQAIAAHNEKVRLYRQFAGTDKGQTKAIKGVFAQIPQRRRLALPAPDEQAGVQGAPGVQGATEAPTDDLQANLTGSIANKDQGSAPAPSKSIVNVDLDAITDPTVRMALARRLREENDKAQT